MGFRSNGLGREVTRAGPAPKGLALKINAPSRFSSLHETAAFLYGELWDFREIG